MALIFKRFRTGDSLHKAVSQENFDKIYNILEDTVGEGCDIERNGNTGKGWKIVVPLSFGDADEDVRSASTASIEIRHDDESNQNVIALKGFKDEAVTEAENLEEVAILARNRNDDTATLIYVDAATIVPVDSQPVEEGEEATSRSIARNEAGELELYGVDSITPKSSFSEEERSTAALVFVDTAETPEVKYASLDAVVATDSGADNPTSQSIEKGADGELRLYNFTEDDDATLPTDTDSRQNYTVLARNKSSLPELEYVSLDHLVLLDSDADSPTSKSLATIANVAAFYNFFARARTAMSDSLRNNVAFILRDNSNSVPQVIYATVPTVVPTDDSGSASKSITRNTDGELALYKFLQPSGGTISKDNQAGFYVLCRASDGKSLLQKKLDFGTAEEVTGYSGDVTSVSEVSYSTTTHELKYKVQTLTYENGLLKTVGAATETLIDQAVEETV